MNRQLSIAFQTDKTAAEYIALAKLVDRYAFDVVSVYCDAPYHPSYGLLLMAPYISRARLGTAAVSPFRIHPIDIAANTALLSSLANAGVYIGLARGAWLHEHGIKEPERPLQALREAIEIIRRLLSGNSAGYQGEVYQIAAHVRAPYPLPDQEIPVLVGTWGRKLAALAGELANEVKVGGSANPEFVPVMRQYIHEGETRAKRLPGSVGLVMGAVCVVDEDRALARQAARRAVALYLPVVAPLDPTLEVDLELVERIRQEVNAGKPDFAAKWISDDLLERFAFAGNPADLLRQAESLFDAGANRIEFGTPHGLPPAEGMRLLGEKVLPALRA
jgi:5,10-methylenetetrahydromethanopterin reductase